MCFLTMAFSDVRIQTKGTKNLKLEQIKLGNKYEKKKSAFLFEHQREKVEHLSLQ